MKKDRTLFPSIFSAITQIHGISGGINEFHAIGERADSLLEVIQKQKIAFQKQESDGKPTISHFILFDRSVDLTSLFVTPLTYEGLIDDVLGISLGATSVPSSMIGGVGMWCSIYM